MKKRILSFLLILIIVVSSVFFNYKKADAFVFEGLLGVAAANPVVAGVCAGLVVGGVIFTGKTIYENKETLGQACQVIADGYINHIKKKVSNAVATVELGYEFLDCLYDKTIEVGSDAWEYWKDYVHDLSLGQYDILDFKGTIFEGNIENFPTLENITVKQSGSRPTSKHTYKTHINFGDYSYGLYSKSQINAENIKLVSVAFSDLTIGTGLYLSSVGTGICCGIGPMTNSSLVGFPYVSAGNYNWFTSSSSYIYGYVDLSNTYPSNAYIDGSDIVFNVSSTFEEFKNHVGANANDSAICQSVLEGVAPRVYDIDNWGNWQETITDGSIDDYPVERAGVNSVDSLEGIPNSVTDAIDNGQAWDVVPNTHVDNWGTTATIPDSVSVNTDMRGLGWDDVATIDDAIAYAKAHGIPLSRVLEEMGVDVGDVARDISYTKTYEATMTDSLVDDFVQTQEKVPSKNQTIKPIVPGSKNHADSEYTLPGLDELFPFCVPFDVYRILKFLDAKPKAPVLKWNIPTYQNGSIRKNEIKVDLSDYDDIAEIFRTLEFLAFAFGFVLIVRNLIKG